MGTNPSDVKDCEICRHYTPGMMNDRCTRCISLIPHGSTDLPLFELRVPKMVQVSEENVDKPSHYTQGNIEVIDFIEDQALDFRIANVVKYVCRYRYKNGLEDLKKARWYLNRMIKALGGE